MSLSEAKGEHPEPGSPQEYFHFSNSQARKRNWSREKFPSGNLFVSVGERGLSPYGSRTGLRVSGFQPYSQACPFESFTEGMQIPSFVHQSKSPNTYVSGSVLLWAREDSLLTGAVHLFGFFGAELLINIEKLFESFTEGMQIPSFVHQKMPRLSRSIIFVGERGLEPPSLAAPAPKAGVSTNFTTRPNVS